MVYFSNYKGKKGNCDVDPEEIDRNVTNVEEKQDKVIKKLMEMHPK